MKVLIIEDEEEMLQNMKQTLEKEDYLVETATDYDSAFLKIGVYEYDCILLDISLPGKNGLEILKELKKRRISDGVIIVSAKNSLDDKLEGLHLGADDYLPKPFHMAELNARIKAVFRRRNLKGNTFIQIENLKINIEDRIAFIEGEELLLNRKEFDILFYLTSNRNRLVNKTALAEHVWGDHIDQTDSFDFIYSQIKNLRKKLKDHQAQIEVKAIYGIGYKLVSL
ncbi:response regulator transcription factor [Mesonia mobilis]|uniref:DNA-binding response regulator n=1 Tax=Mesonia mobilis TaxID=369791 RepID=A0ABQ3BP82_9FLAO|nr:response regulator transcription factor [Mesonia mobilis]MBQ0738436.1 response regulator transcription factor [Aquimarina celericrescens]GGZ52575.1 DNA-binding response regulator [Mesonia mobilis]